jgi:hypothetical protein
MRRGCGLLPLLFAVVLVDRPGWVAGSETNFGEQIDVDEAFEVDLKNNPYRTRKYYAVKDKFFISTYGPNPGCHDDDQEMDEEGPYSTFTGCQKQKGPHFLTAVNNLEKIDARWMVTGVNSAPGLEGVCTMGGHYIKMCSGMIQPTAVGKSKFCTRCKIGDCCPDNNGNYFRVIPLMGFKKFVESAKEHISFIWFLVQNLSLVVLIGWKWEVISAGFTILKAWMLDACCPHGRCARWLM